MLRKSKTVLDFARAGAQFVRAQDKAGASLIQLRWLGDPGVPEFFARPSKYTDGADFLGTPPNHIKLLQKRPVSPDVFELNSTTKMHYKMPWGALSSIANRGTGAVLTGGFWVASYIALTGDLSAFLLALKSYPLILYPAKTAIAFPLIYHYMGGIRHAVWDMYHIGNQTDKADLLETPKVELSSQIILGASAALALLATIL